MYLMQKRSQSKEQNLMLGQNLMLEQNLDYVELLYKG